MKSMARAKLRQSRESIFEQQKIVVPYKLYNDSLIEKGFITNMSEMYSNQCSFNVCGDQDKLVLFVVFASGARVPWEKVEQINHIIKDRDVILVFIKYGDRNVDQKPTTREYPFAELGKGQTKKNKMPAILQVLMKEDPKVNNKFLLDEKKNECALSEFSSLLKYIQDTT
eukprot:TRINITY_DN5603_c0_g1_i2.p1 TRINITY_DN5603_c0_g1~~TRINITY_DN5603_c0_g1_i2.p1  ORF type:complete len:170 (-),score=26.24 TRINITY_DN5603_c0_g1_i2:2-511(-)